MPAEEKVGSKSTSFFLERLHYLKNSQPTEICYQGCTPITETTNSTTTATTWCDDSRCIASICMLACIFCPLWGQERRKQVVIHFDHNHVIPLLLFLQYKWVIYGSDAFAFHSLIPLRAAFVSSFFTIRGKKLDTQFIFKNMNWSKTHLQVAHLLAQAK